MAAEPPVFLFDLGSPYAWLAAERIGRVLPRPARWQPVLLGGIFARTRRGSWALTQERGRGIAEVESRAAAYGLPPVRWPDPWPGDMLFAMRAAVHAAEAGRVEEFALAAFRRAFTAGRDLSLPEEVLAAAAAAGLDPSDVRAAAADRRIKDALRAATDAAADRGVTGVPTVAVGGDLFWGDDRLEEAAAAVA